MRTVFFHVFLFLSFFSVFADISITKKESDMTVTEYYAGGKYALYEGGSPVTIIDLKNSRIISMSSGKGIYVDEKFKNYLNGLKTFYEKIKAKMSQVPGAGMTEMMKKFKPQYKNTGTEKLAGWTCEIYEVSINGMKSSEIWVSGDLRKEISKEFDFGKLVEFQKELQKTGSISGIPLNTDETPEDKGYVMYEKDLLNSAGRGEAFVKPEIRIEKTKIDSKIFSVPEGLRKVSISDFLDSEMSSGMEGEGYDMDDFEGME